MPDYVTLDTLNVLRFPTQPVPISKLQRWCRDGVLPARKFGGEWRVDLLRFDDERESDSPDPLATLVARKLSS